MQILSVAEMQAAEAQANAIGHTFARMMELAGQAVARAVVERVPVRDRNVLVLVGPGNNGGDGLVAATYLAQAGAKVTAYLSHPREEENGVYRRAVEAGVTMLLAEADAEKPELRRLILRCDVLIDALLGTGTRLPLRGAIADILQGARRALSAASFAPLTSLTCSHAPMPPRPFIVAVDGPTGMDFDTGALDPLALTAHLTVTFAAPKWGHVRFPAASVLGELVVADIGIPAECWPRQAGVEMLTVEQVRSWLPARPADAHKGTFGSALLVAGSLHYTGAALLATQAALRSGVGLVTVALPAPLQGTVIAAAPEATALCLPHTEGALNGEGAPLVLEQLPQYHALLIGPGLGQNAETQTFVRSLLGLKREKRGTGLLQPVETWTSSGEARALPPMIFDADGLNILSKIPNWPKLLPPRTIITPHPGEMARLTGKSVAEVQSRRVDIAQEIAQALNLIVVLKGAFTVVAAPEGPVALVPFANAGLAKGGTGDVLAGLITGLRAQRLGAFEAAAVGAYLHALAGDIARQQLGEMGMTAGDVVRALPEAIRRVRGEVGGR